MGVYTEKFRELIEKLPKTPDQFASPIHAASAMAQLTNGVLQVLASLEESLEDAQKENERLQEMLMEKDTPNPAGIPTWWPSKE
jgi:hypothetical protein